LAALRIKQINPPSHQEGTDEYEEMPM